MFCAKKGNPKLSLRVLYSKKLLSPSAKNMCKITKKIPVGDKLLLAMHCSSRLCFIQKNQKSELKHKEKRGKIWRTVHRG